MHGDILNQTAINWQPGELQGSKTAEKLNMSRKERNRAADKISNEGNNILKDTVWRSENTVTVGRVMKSLHEDCLVQMKNANVFLRFSSIRLEQNVASDTSRDDRCSAVSISAIFWFFGTSYELCKGLAAGSMLYSSLTPSMYDTFQHRSSY